MRVTVAVGGAFHGFLLAAQLDRYGYLHRLLTTHRPRRGEFVDPRRIEVNLVPELFLQLPQRLRLSWRGDYYKAQLFDWWAAQRIRGEEDLLVAFAAFALHTIRAARPYGTFTVLERSSAHILFQRALLEEEYVRWGLPPAPFDERLVRKQLWEYGEADVIAVPSTFVRDSFLTQGVPPERLIQIPLGVDTDRYAPHPKADPTFRILAGGLSLQKGLPYLLEAVRALPGQGVELVFAGRIADDVRHLLRTYPCPIHHVGILPARELAALYPRCSVVVLPSVQDGFGMVLLEAMASGVPVICSDHTAGPDVVRHGVDGYVVPVRNSTAIRDHLMHLLESEDERRRMGEAARQRALEFSLERYGARLVEEYSALLARKPDQAGASTREFYRYFWQISNVWDDCRAWSDDQYERHFGGWVQPSDVVLDVGCGDARAYQARLLGTVAALYGVDISEEAVAKARARGVQASVHDLSHPLPYADETFDKVVCFEVLEHLFDPKFAVQEMARVLRPGGVLLASVPNAGYLRDRLLVLLRGEVEAGVTDFANPWKAPHVRFFNQGRLEAMLRACGLRVRALKSKSDPSIFDVLAVFGGPGRFAARHLSERLPRSVRLAFLGNLWPALFAPALLVAAEKPPYRREPSPGEAEEGFLREVG